MSASPSIQVKVLIIGGGGREHALAWKIQQSPLVKALFCAPGNAGIAQFAACAPIDLGDVQALADHADAVDADLTVVGPEGPMVQGLGDELQRRGRLAFCPSRRAAELEGSKAFARAFMDRHGIPSPRHLVCDSLADARLVIESARLGWPLVIKADGLAAGKGVFIAADERDALAVVAQVLAEKSLGAAGERVVFEEFLHGEEVSFFAFADGRKVLPLATAQDHKRIFDNDLGPNTGGMGTVSPAPAVSTELGARIMDEIVTPTIAGMASEGQPYRGVLFAGLMLTTAGPKVLEFNARFGDPETQCLMTRLDSDIVPVLMAVARGDLGGASCTWNAAAAACVVIAASGYPEKPRAGDEIRGLAQAAARPGVSVFHAGTKAAADGAVVTAGGRVLGVTARGTDLAAALGAAYGAVGDIRFSGMHYRKDIGAAAVRRQAAATQEEKNG